MVVRKSPRKPVTKPLPPTPPIADKPVTKKPTGIRGFDDITGGGLPENRLTAIIGSPGAGKTVFALNTLVNRLRTNGERAIFVTFEEPIDHIRRNIASFDWRFDEFAENDVRFIDARVPVDAVLAGAFDLTGLLAGLTALKEESGACNIVFDGIDMLLSSLRDERLERQELARLDQWIRESELSALITVKAFGISDRDQLRSDFLQYITDCVIVLAGTFSETASSRTLRVVKYRGSGFAANPVPVVIGRSGYEVVSFKGARISYPTFTERVSSGVARLDSLLDGGYIRGSSILISGSPGTSKTSLAACFAIAACERGKKSLLISFDESASQIVSNLRSIGLDLGPQMAAGNLVMESLLSSGRSPEEHFVTIRDLLDMHAPDCLVIDPLSSLLKAEYPFSGLICESVLDQAKSRGITILCTSLLEQVGGDKELSASRISTVADTWIHVSYIAKEGERNRALTIVKSRGTPHSNQVRELVLDASGIDLVDVYVAEGEVLMGTGRAQKEAEMRRHEAQLEIDYKRRRLELDRSLAELKAQVDAVTRELEWRKQEETLLDVSERDRLEQVRSAADVRMQLRRGRDDTTSSSVTSRRKRRGL